MDVFFLQRAIDSSGARLKASFVLDGQEVLDYLEGTRAFSDRQKYPMPELIMLDLKMPRLDGFDVLAWLRAQPRHRATPVVIFSGSDDHGDVTRAYLLGANSYMVKPTQTAEMPELVRALETYWRRYVKLPAPCS
jgi:CheY-like chemotaxis protein